jgi:PAS domain S-box-containing protein
MSVELSYQELKSQNEELKKQNELLKSENANRIQEEQKLIGINSKLNTLADNVPAFIAYVDAKTLKYEFVNKAYQKYFGIPLDKIVGSHVKEIIGETNFQFALKYIEEAKAGNSTSYENTFDLNTGKRWNKVNYVPYFDKNGNVDSIIVLTYDITDRKQAEQELVESEENFRAIFENSTAAQALLEFDKTYSLVNDAFTKICGYSKEEITGKSWTENIAPNDLERLNEYSYQRIINPNEAIKKYEFSFIKKNGSIGHALMSIDLLPHVKKIMASFTEITEIREKEIQLQKITNELNQLNLDKDRFISILAHDLKNPFNAILGLFNILTKNIRIYDIDTIEEQLNLIGSSAQSAFNLLEELLIWTSSQSGKLSFKPQKLDLNKICWEIISEIKPIADSKNITINNLTTNEFKVVADNYLLKIVLRNLVSNAVKFTNPSGKVDILAEQNQKNIIISISDNGIGMSNEIIDKLFDITQKPTTIGTANETGTGLGLILCKELIEKHKGEIWVESELEKGSNFRFTLPLD